MTAVENTIAMMRERRDLHLVAKSIRSQTTLGPEWAAVLVAIDDRLKWSTYAITVTDPQLVAYAEAVLAAEPDPKSAFTSNDWTSAWEVH